jgi:hypothetical protein
MATWPIKKTVTINGIDVSVTADKSTRPDHLAVIKVTATAGDVSHCEMMTLPKNNPSYAAVQCQKDFDAHVLKVATEAAGKYVAHTVADSLV